MNKAYRIVWSAARQAWVVACERAGCGGRPPVAVKRIAGTLLLLGMAGSAAATTYDGTTVSGSILSLNNGDVANNVSVISGGNLNVNNGGLVTSSNVGNGVGLSNIVVSSGGNAVSTTVNSSGRQYINSGGSATSTVLNGGSEIVYVGANVSGSTVNSRSQQEVYGEVTSTTVNSGGALMVLGGTSHFTHVNSSGIEYVLSGSSDSALIDNWGNQIVYAGASAVSATVAGGTQQVNGTASDTTVKAGGVQYVNSGGSSTDTQIEANASQGIYGTATSTQVNSGGSQYVYSGGSASLSMVHNSGYMLIFGGGSASNAIIDSGATLNTYAGATATGLVVSSGGSLVTNTGATLDGTNALGAFSISAGHAKNLLLENNGSLIVNATDSSENTVINQGGVEYVLGSATGTVVNQYGIQRVNAGGTATGTTVNAGGEQDVFGTAISTTVNSGGLLAVYDGGVASQAMINSGGSLSVNSGGTATDATVQAGGLLNITDGAVLTLADNHFVNNGTTTYDTTSNMALNTNLSGTGELTKNGSGTLTLGGTLSQSQVNLNAGSLIMDGLDATTDVIALSGTSLSLVNSASLTGIIDPTDVTIDSSSTWNMTGDSLVDTLTNAGSIVFAAPTGTFTPHTLTVTNLVGNGGTITLNTVAGDSSSPADKLIIDGGQATGTTGLRVLNRGGLGAQTTGNGITLVSAINGATTDTNAFNLSQPLVAGAYSYSLYRNADQSWYLTSQLTTTDTQEPAEEDTGTATPVRNTVNYRDGMWSYAALPSLSLDYDRLVAGTADTRFHYAKDSRMWGRVVAGQLRHGDHGNLTGGGVPESSGAYSFLQIGGDLWQFAGSRADWRAGVYGATGLMRNDVWRDGGSKEAGTDRDTVYTGGAYLSGLTQDGLRLDGLLQVSHHSISTASNDGTRSSTSGTGWLASAQAGQAFTLSPALSLEPQLMYTVQGISLDDAHDEAASLDWSDSHRQSVQAGLKVGTPANYKAKVQWWVTPALTQSFGGHSSVSASVQGVSDSTASFRTNFSGTSVGLNGGINGQIRDNVILGVQAGWSEGLHGSESGGFYGLVNLGYSFR
ncbi:autotransporter outer membrane beta-barrel domain-containing protein [Candidatus Pantoea deserta]|uniref:Autotransporter outer membrane beta-barrel domain-containing protein n=1 Tax=Candidatus Pantoea deserta TaxID=1869313 RepID=A0A3N4ND93_9GAMM|nr:AIDA repeat-containing protein [Pantoea deserta]RPD94274.1 autotransporter outer membrane beta-barrel domain-containing protein [Pantoea deserta]